MRGVTGTKCFPLCLMRGVRPVVQGEEREEAVRPDRGLSAGPSSCRLVTVRATNFLLSQHQSLRGLGGLRESEHNNITRKMSQCPSPQ